GGNVLPSPDAQQIVDWVKAGELYAAPQPLAAGLAGAIAALPAPDALVVAPAARNLVDAGASQQVLVFAWWSNGETADVTRAATITGADANGVVQGSGLQTITATWAGLSGQI